MKKKTKSKKPVRLFAGFSSSDYGDGIVLDTVLPGTPAKKAGLKAGDRVLSIGKHHIETVNDVSGALRRKVLVAYQRKNKFRETTLRCVNLYKKGGIQFIADIGTTKVNRRCDSNCDCTIKVKNAICRTYYVTKGDGPHEGVLLEKNCTFSAMPPGEKPFGDNKNCGTREYF